jgi:mRNA interferase RelE/StbE
LAYKLVIDDKVTKDLKKIDKSWQRKILDVIKTKLIEDPYHGKKLVGDLSPYYRYRVGDYRIIYEIIDEEVVVIVIKVKHRKESYKNR